MLLGLQRFLLLLAPVSKRIVHTAGGYEFELAACTRRRLLQGVEVVALTELTCEMGNRVRLALLHQFGKSYKVI